MKKEYFHGVNINGKNYQAFTTEDDSESVNIKTTRIYGFEEPKQNQNKESERPTYTDHPTREQVASEGVWLTLGAVLGVFLTIGIIIGLCAFFAWYYRMGF